MLICKMKFYYTALHYCIKDDYRQDVLDALIKAEADFNIQDKDDFGKKTPLLDSIR